MAKNPDAGFNLQYQAEVKVLEQNGFKDIETDYVLKGEKFTPIKINNELIIREHILDFEKRQNTAQNLINEIVCGYAIYSLNGVKKVFIVENDILKTSHQMSNDRSDKAGKANLKWNFKKAIDISIVHALFRHLVLKDWDSEEFEYQSEAIKEIKPQPKSIDDLVDDYTPQISSQDIQVVSAEEDFEMKV